MAGLRYQIKALKALKSGAYTATLYCGNTKVAYIEDSGRGGAPHVNWLGGTYAEWKPIEDAFLAWWKAEVPEWHWTHAYRDNEYVIESAVSFVIDVAEWNRLAKRGTVLVFRRPVPPLAPEQIYTQAADPIVQHRLIAAAKADGLEVWDYAEQGWVA